MYKKAGESNTGKAVLSELVLRVGEKCRWEKSFFPIQVFCLFCFIIIRRVFIIIVY